MEGKRPPGAGRLTQKCYSEIHQLADWQVLSGYKDDPCAEVLSRYK
jgi:hypothetical protein